MGDRLRPGAYAVRARFSRSALLLGADERALFVVDRSIGAGPLNLVVPDPHAFLPGAAFALPRNFPAPRFDSSLPRPDRAARARLRRVLETVLPRHAPPDSLVSLFAPAAPLSRLRRNRDARFRAALAHFAAGRFAAGARLIRGCGEGLTPAGDDFLCGWLLALRLRRLAAPIPALLKNARGTNPVSNAFLEMAAAGRANVAVKQLLQAPSSARVKKVCAFGHSSGADLLCGMFYGLSAEIRRAPGSGSPRRSISP